MPARQLWLLVILLACALLLATSAHAKKPVVINHAPKKPTAEAKPEATAPAATPEVTDQEVDDAPLVKDAGKPKVLTPKMKALLGIEDTEDVKPNTCAGGDVVGSIKFRNNALQVCTETGWWTVSAREGDGKSPETAASSCLALKQAGYKSSQETAYYINPKRTNNPNDAVLVYCDMETDGGGWTLVGYAEHGDFRLSGQVPNFVAFNQPHGQYYPFSRRGSACVDGSHLFSFATEVAYTFDTKTLPLAGISSYEYAFKHPKPGGQLDPRQSRYTPVRMHCFDNTTNLHKKTRETMKCPQVFDTWTKGVMYTGTNLGVMGGAAYGVISRPEDYTPPSPFSIYAPEARIAPPALNATAVNNSLHSNNNSSSSNSSTTEPNTSKAHDSAAHNSMAAVAELLNSDTEETNVFLKQYGYVYLNLAFDSPVWVAGFKEKGRRHRVVKTMGLWMR